MQSFFKRLKLVVSLVFNKDAANLLSVPAFASANKNLLMIVCDPDSDRIFVTYRDKYVNGKIKSATGKNTHVVKEVVKYSRFPNAIDDFITALVETLHLPLKNGNQFFQFIDGAVYNIGKSLRNDRKPDVPMPGAVPSPFMQKDISK